MKKINTHIFKAFLGSKHLFLHMHTTVFMVFFLKVPNYMLNMGSEDESRW